MAQNIYFQKGIIFRMMSKMDNSTEYDLCKYISEIKSQYMNNDGINHTFFWKYENGCISTDITVCGISTDIRDQLITISSWIFSRGYRLKGEFYLRLPDSIECISMDGISKLIKFYVLIDPINFNLNKETDVIIEARQKMEKYLEKRYNLGDIPCGFTETCIKQVGSTPCGFTETCIKQVGGTQDVNPSAKDEWGNMADDSFSRSNSSEPKILSYRDEQTIQEYKVMDAEKNKLYGIYQGYNIEDVINSVIKEHFMGDNLKKDVNLNIICGKNIYCYTIVKNRIVGVSDQSDSNEMNCDVSSEPEESSSDDLEFNDDDITDNPPKRNHILADNQINGRLDKIESGIQLNNIMNKIFIIFSMIVLGFFGFTNFFH